MWEGGEEGVGRDLGGISARLSDGMMTGRVVLCSMWPDTECGRGRNKNYISNGGKSMGKKLSDGMRTRLRVQIHWYWNSVALPTIIARVQGLIARRPKS